MKATLILFFIVFISYSANSQNYKPILSDSNYWYSAYVAFDRYQTDVYYASRDTSISGNTYKILDLYHFNQNCFIREDTAERKLFYRHTSGFRPNEDILIYDFSMAVDDSMLLFNPNAPATDSVGYYLLDSIGAEMLADGSTSRVFHLHSRTTGDRAEWVEGVGSRALVNTAAVTDSNSLQLSLSCLYKNGVLTYQSKRSVEYGDCYLYTVDVEKITSNKLEFNLTPNPASTLINMKFNQKLSGKLFVLNSVGENVVEINLNQEDSYSLGGLDEFANGIYHVIFSDGTSKLTSTMIISH